MQRVEARYSIEEGISISITFSFEECDKRILEPFWVELVHKSDVMRRLQKRGLIEKYELLKEYIICQYGGNDSIPDLDGEFTTSDYTHCGCRGYCKDEGFPGLCSFAIVNGVKLTPSEVQALQLSTYGLSAKMAADHKHRSPNTLKAQDRKIREKLNVNNMIAAVAQSVECGITKTEFTCKR